LTGRYSVCAVLDSRSISAIITTIDNPMIDIFPIDYYTKIFYWTMFVFCTLTVLYYHDSKGCVKLLRQNSILLPLLLSTVLIFFIGLRPISWIFSDMVLYRHRWNIIDTDLYVSNFGLGSEWFFDTVMIMCKKTVPDAQFCFLVIDIFYIGCQLWACKKLLWENVWLAIMFVFFSYQFFTYGTNGLRNGMGCALMMLSISYFCDRSKLGFFVGFLLFILAMGCHRSVLVPMTALVASLFVIKDINKAIIIWLGCIVLSLLAGNSIMGFFENLGYDNRMSDYSTISDNLQSQFSHIGFRWDFLLYSTMPISLAWYIRRLGVQDKTFTILANTYILANSFWVLVCRAAFSNRFAYLSWFMYALVIAYAVIRIPIWKDQDRKASQILFAHSFFTIFMFVIGR